MAKADLTAQRLRELLHYDPETGAFTRLVASYNNVARVGKPAGYVCGNGYFYVPLDGRRLLAHRLAWLYVYGIWPKGQIDHINGERTDNRLENLRDVPPRVNNENRRKVRADNCSSGLTGVSKQRESWRARIYVAGKCRFLGQFKTAEEASAAYLAAKRALHEGCTI